MQAEDVQFRGLGKQKNPKLLDRACKDTYDMISVLNRKIH